MPSCQSLLYPVVVGWSLSWGIAAICDEPPPIYADSVIVKAERILSDAGYVHGIVDPS